jgi:hypothetical protein
VDPRYLDNAYQPSQMMGCSLQTTLLCGLDMGIDVLASRAFKQWAAEAATEEARHLGRRRHRYVVLLTDHDAPFCGDLKGKQTSRATAAPTSSPATR